MLLDCSPVLCPTHVATLLRIQGGSTLRGCAMVETVRLCGDWLLLYQLAHGPALRRSVACV